MSGAHPSPITVLCVDDEPALTKLTSTYLERQFESLEVRTVNEPEAALERFEQEEIDCIVSDYQMPKMNGVELLRAIRDRDADTPFILFTGEGSEEVASEAISAGVTDYLKKQTSPKQYEILATQIRNAVGKWRAEREVAVAHRAIETAREGISILDSDGIFTYVNKAYGEVYGYESDELVGKHFETLYREEDLESVYETILPTLEVDGVWNGETVGVRKDGSVFREDHSLAETDTGHIVCVVREMETDEDVEP